MSDAVSLAQRIELFQQTSPFADAPEAALRDLSRVVKEREYPEGTIVVTEGEPVESVYIIVQGRTEVSSQIGDGSITLATQERADIFGELGLLSASRRRTARRTVTAIAPLLVLEIVCESVQGVVDLHPSLRPIFELSGEIMLVARFLKRASPFAKLTGHQLHWLAGKLESLEVEPGATIVQQGEHDDKCFLVRVGRVEVVLREDDEPDRCLATLGPGSMVGEATLLSEEPRAASVRALELCELLVLHRPDLLEAMTANQAIGARVIELLRLRARPLRVDGVLHQEQTTPDRDTVHILKNPQLRTYFRLSTKGWFIWRQLDGRNTLRDLTLAYRREFGTFSPQLVANLVEGLGDAGFIEGRRLRADVAAIAQSEPGWQRATLLARQVMEWNVGWHNIDRSLTRWYRRGVHVLYTRPSQVLLGALCIVGMLCFLLSTVRATSFIANSDGGVVLLIFLIPAEWLSVVVHEAGHAFTTKAFGREVHRVGIGWYWFGPVTFVDTSDMWLSGRWPRIAVSLAGPYANILLASLAAVAGYFSGIAWLTALCWQFAITSYILVLINLNPLLEYDGYYILMDVLDRPNLRAHCLQWLGSESLRAVFRPREMLAHRTEAVYGLASLTYVIIMAAVTVEIYRLVAQQWVSSIAPADVSIGLAWILALAVVFITISAVIGELRGVRSKPIHA